jgi:hypothetical protein
MACQAVISSDGLFQHFHAGVAGSSNDLNVLEDSGLERYLHDNAGIVPCRSLYDRSSHSHDDERAPNPLRAMLCAEL